MPWPEQMPPKRQPGKQPETAEDHDRYPHHLQGICVDKDAIYCFFMQLVKGDNMRWVAALTGSLIILPMSSAVACPFCESETAAQVRAGIFNDHFGMNVLLTLLPFPILLAIVALIYFDLSRLWTKPQMNADAVSSPAPLPLIGE